MKTRGPVPSRPLRAQATAVPSLAAVATPLIGRADMTDGVPDQGAVVSQQSSPTLYQLT